ncbi:hypothetical protein HQ36_01995 [Porphyromonas gingivicanis]|uniref:Uncharacterized protein n=1 Tax=Porphyromonas gingivicanis TaxID=266762 RepID=A0A0A2GD90_9PORP|nr:hypothetical protein [Porphyromonas gingivicanis]KGN98409.1 hypothetical protein HQ36_01995 [Porphyromonas gingivicanis]
MNENNFSIVFENERNEVSAELLIGCLMHTTSIITEVNKLIGPEKIIDIKVKAFEKGSFQVDIELIEGLIATLFSSRGVEYVANIIETVSGIYKLVNFLGGKKPKEISKEGNSVTITNQSGGSVVINQQVFNVYGTSPEIRSHIQKQFKQMQDYEDISGFRFQTREEVVYTPKQDFPVIAMPIVMPNQEEPAKTTTIENVPLKILRPSFDEKLGWDFIYEGQKISAKVKDKDILKQIDMGEAFAKGCRMLADLEITYYYDAGVDEYMLTKDSYRIVKFKKLLPPPPIQEPFI